MTGLKKTIVITGSHHTPAIELIKQLRSDTVFSWQIEYIAQIFPNETHIKNTIVNKLNVSFHHLDSGKYDRRWLPNTIKGIPQTLRAIVKAYLLLKRLRPDVVISFGGYISVPVIFSAWILGIPGITHEQTLTLSLATKINSWFVKKIALSYPIITNNPKTVITGNLLRSEILDQTSPQYHHLNSILTTRPLIYITGGSQGSHFLNQITQTLIKKISGKYTIIHTLGNTDFSSHLTMPNYYPTTYINLEDIGWVMNHSKIIISRSGANICQEIVALRKNSILIPLPFSQQKEQELNALWVKKCLPQNTVILNQNRISIKKMLTAISTLSLKPSLPPAQNISNPNLIKLIHEII